MTEPTELLPCPFCGGAPTTIERPDNIDGTQFFYAIACYCGRHSACAHKMAVRKTPEIAKADAIAAWNTRTPQAGAVPLTDGQIDAAAKKLAECMEYPWEFMPEPGRKNMRKHAQDVIEAAHGIKGGQHGGM